MLAVQSVNLLEHGIAKGLQLWPLANKNQACPLLVSADFGDGCSFLILVPNVSCPKGSRLERGEGFVQ